MAETVAERVIKVFAEFKKMPPEDIKMETTFEELGLDSLDGLNLVFELEEEFDLTVPDDKIKDFKSVAQVVEGMEMLVEAKAQGIDVEAEAAKDFAAQQAAFRAQKAAKETAEKDAEAEAGKTDGTQTEDASAQTEESQADDAPAETKPTENSSTDKKE